MATLARTLDVILDSIQATHADVDPTIDIQKGPISVLLYSFAAELTRVESNTSYLSSVYQLEIANELQDDDLINLARNYGLDPDSGIKATVIVTFYRIARPLAGEVYSVDEGTIVSTADNRLSFTLTSGVEMDGDSADIYYNATTQRYEISVSAHAVANGTDYNVPTGTIVNISSDSQDFEGVVNTSDATGGQDPLDAFQIRNLIWDSIQGLAADSTGRIISTISGISPNGFDDIALVASTQYGIFRRLESLNGRQGYDVYLITDSFIQDLQSGVALGGETSIPLDKSPTLGVERVTVDGTPVSYYFQQDQDSSINGSKRATDKVILDTPLQPAQTYEIRYYYFDLIYEAGRAFESDSSPFGVDVLVRRANPVPIYIAAQLTTSPDTDKNAVIVDIKDYTADFFRDPVSPSFGRSSFINILDPASYEDSVKSAISGISTFKVTNFVRTDKAVMDIEIIEFDGYTEYPLLSPNSDIR